MSTSYKKIIIIGAPRSGTNMLRDLLCNIDGVGTWPCDEINYIWKHGNIGSLTDELSPVMATTSVIKYIRNQFNKFAHKEKLGFVVEKTCDIKDKNKTTNRGTEARTSPIPPSMRQRSPAPSCPRPQYTPTTTEELPHPPAMYTSEPGRAAKMTCTAGTQKLRCQDHLRERIQPRREEQPRRLAPLHGRAHTHGQTIRSSHGFQLLRQKPRFRTIRRLYLGNGNSIGPNNQLHHRTRLL